MKKKCVFRGIVSMLLILSMIISPFMKVQVKAEQKEDISMASKESSTGVLTTKDNVGVSSVSGSAIGITDQKFIGDGFEAEFKVTSRWEGAFNGSITITNTSDIAIENWILMFDMKNDISNIWNASIESFDNGIYLIKNATWNQDIPIGGSVDFGFSAIGDEIDYPKGYSIPTSEECADSSIYTIDFVLNSDWGTGFSATINITNNSDKAIEDWILEFDFDKEITDIWNGYIVEHTGTRYKVKNASYNQNIALGETISVGFNGMDGHIVDLPYNYV